MRSLLNRLYGWIHRHCLGRGFGLGIFTFFHNRVWHGWMRPKSVHRYGAHFFLDPRDAVYSTTLILDSQHENAMVKTLESVLAPGMTFLDIGANIGVYSVLASKKVGPSGRVGCVEPTPATAAVLLRNLEANGCANATIFPFAAGETTGPVTFYAAAEGGSRNSLYHKPSLGKTAALTVVVLPLAEVLGPAWQPDVVKIDVEGAELPALRGLHGYLQNPRLRSLLIEWHEPTLKEVGTPENALADLLAPYGFKSRRIDYFNLLFTR